MREPLLAVRMDRWRTRRYRCQAAPLQTHAACLDEVALITNDHIVLLVQILWVAGGWAVQGRATERPYYTAPFDAQRIHRHFASNNTQACHPTRRHPHSPQLTHHLLHEVVADDEALDALGHARRILACSARGRWNSQNRVSPVLRLTKRQGAAPTSERLQHDRARRPGLLQRVGTCWLGLKLQGVPEFTMCILSSVSPSQRCSASAHASAAAWVQRQGAQPSMPAWVGQAEQQASRLPAEHTTATAATAWMFTAQRGGCDDEQRPFIFVGRRHCDGLHCLALQTKDRQTGADQWPLGVTAYRPKQQPESANYSHSQSTRHTHPLPASAPGPSRLQ